MPPRVVRKVWPGLIKGFKSTNPINAFLLAAIISSTITWIAVSANNSIDDEIRHHLSHKNIHVQQAAVWAANFLVAFSAAISIYLLMYLLFGYGEGMTVSDPWTVRQIKRILHKLEMDPQMHRCAVLDELSYFPSWATES